MSDGSTVVVGIDEAGYGPLLGPLVVSSSAFSVPQRMSDSDLWHTLKNAVAKHKRHLAGRLLVADSKKAYTSSGGIDNLRRTVLAFMAVGGKSPFTASELLERLCPDCVDRFADYPWHSELADYDLGAGAEDLHITAGVLQKTLHAAGIRFLGFSTVCLDVAYYNRMIQAVKNKAKVLFTAVASLIQRACDISGADRAVEIIVDRLGGRADYRRNLQLMFDGMDLKVLRQDGDTSSYELTGGSRIIRVHFKTGADDKYLPVSLASMAGKYLREVLMDSLNRYFTNLHCGLKPTAGYWQDGTRFIEELKSRCDDFDSYSDKLIRCK